MRELKRIIGDFILLIFYFILPNRRQVSFKHDFGICSLTTHKDVILLVYCLTSFFYFSRENFKVFIVSDGTLNTIDKWVLKRNFNCIIKDKAALDNELIKKIKKYKYLSDYRFNEKLDRIRLKVDAVIASPFKKFIYLDSDILFKKKPSEILNWIRLNSKETFYTVHKEKFFLDDHFPEFSFRKLTYDHLKIKMSAGFSSGFFMIPDVSKTSLELLNKACKYLTKYGWIHFGVAEETFYSIYMALISAKSLNTYEYAICSLYSEYRYFQKHSHKVIMQHYGYETKLKFRKEAIQLALKTRFFRKK